MSTYIYGIAHSSHPLPVDGLVGVGADRPPLRVVRAGDLAAAVSDAPEDLRAKRRDLEAHGTALETLGAEGTVLPMRFGTLAADDDAVEAELVTAAERYAELLDRLDGKAELNVKASHREEVVLRGLLQQHQELRELNEALRASGGDYQQTVAFGEKLSIALDERRAADAEYLVAELEPYAAEMRIGPPVDGCLLNASFLVERTAREEFEARVARLGEALSSFIEVRLYGPLPPYSFLAPADVSA